VRRAGGRGEGAVSVWSQCEIGILVACMAGHWSARCTCNPERAQDPAVRAHYHTVETLAHLYAPPAPGGGEIRWAGTYPFLLPSAGAATVLSAPVCSQARGWPAL